MEEEIDFIWEEVEYKDIKQKVYKWEEIDSNLDDGCLGYQYYTDSGYEFDCFYDTDIDCEDCLFGPASIIERYDLTTLIDPRRIK